MNKRKRFRFKYAHVCGVFFGVFGCGAYLLVRFAPSFSGGQVLVFYPTLIVGVFLLAVVSVVISRLAFKLFKTFNQK